MNGNSLPTRFRWEAGPPLIFPVPNGTHPIVSVKDPSVVYVGGQWHVFATTADKKGNWNMVHLKFSDWKKAAKAVPDYLDSNPNLRGYHGAHQVFYFTPQKKWYLIFQSGQPQYSTSDDLNKPETWSAPQDFF